MLVAAERPQELYIEVVIKFTSNLLFCVVRARAFKGDLRNAVCTRLQDLIVS